jgi:hypothetical protein
MPDFRRRDGESALAWAGRLRFADVFALTAGEQDDLHAQRGLAAAAVEAEEEQQAALARAAAESEALRACKTAVRAMTPADRLALLHWLGDDMRR